MLSERTKIEGGSVNVLVWSADIGNGTFTWLIIAMMFADCVFKISQRVCQVSEMSESSVLQ